MFESLNEVHTASDHRKWNENVMVVNASQINDLIFIENLTVI